MPGSRPVACSRSNATHQGSNATYCSWLAQTTEATQTRRLARVRPGRHNRAEGADDRAELGDQAGDGGRVVAADRHRAQLGRLGQLRHDLGQRVDQLGLDGLRRLLVVDRCPDAVALQVEQRRGVGGLGAGPGQGQLAVEARGAAARTRAPAAAARPRAPRASRSRSRRQRVQGASRSAARPAGGRPPGRARPGGPSRPPRGRTSAASLRARSSASSRSFSSCWVSWVRAAVELPAGDRLLGVELGQPGDAALLGAERLLQVLPQPRRADDRLLDLHGDDAQAQPAVAAALALGDRRAAGR